MPVKTETSAYSLQVSHLKFYYVTILKTKGNLFKDNLKTKVIYSAEEL